jgi:hypothetical protein
MKWQLKTIATALILLLSSYRSRSLEGAPTIEMHPGNTPIIEYKTLDGTIWTAELENVHWQVSAGAFHTVIDPDFIHRRVSPPPSDAYNTMHTDDMIAYFTHGGGRWHSKCHSHGDWMGLGHRVTFSFEHFHDDNGRPGDKSHEDGTIIFQDRNGVAWKASIVPFSLDQKESKKPVFTLERVP